MASQLAACSVMASLVLVHFLSTLQMERGVHFCPLTLLFVSGRGRGYRAGVC